MSTKKSKLADLLVRVRYTNPLPAPPFPPKLLNIPTDPARYAKLDFTAALANEIPLPMVVDAECGMPLDLSQWDCLWTDGGDDSALNPDPHNLPILDPEDELLLDEPLAPTPHPNGHSSGPASGPTTPSVSTPQVAWLRKTEYISRAISQRAIEAKIVADAPIDVSVPAQIRDIEATFPPTLDEIDLGALRHPNKPGVTAVESFEILPDVETWANEYDLFRFSERPGDRPVDAEDLRLACAILRPIESQDGEHHLAYYLPKEDADAEEFSQRRQDQAQGDMSEQSPAIFHWLRDYEVVKIEQDVPNEFLLVLDNGEDAVFGSGRAKGAYYKNLERKIMVKKKRVNKHEPVNDTDKWDVIKLHHVPFGPEDNAERDEMAAMVSDPTFMARMLAAEGAAASAVDTNGTSAAPVGEEDPMQMES